jgi:hypothetical protein
MASRLPDRILVHVATPLVTREGADTEWIEGERGEVGTVDRELGVPFACVLFLPGVPEADGGEQSWRPRNITRPTLLYNLRRKDRTEVALRKEHRLSIAAPDLAIVLGVADAEWQLDGAPQPFGRPGRWFGAMATLRRVED